MNNYVSNEKDHSFKIGRLYIELSSQRWAQGAILYKTTLFIKSDTIKRNGSFAFKFRFLGYNFFWRIETKCDHHPIPNRPGITANSYLWMCSRCEKPMKVAAWMIGTP